MSGFLHADLGSGSNRMGFIRFTDGRPDLDVPILASRTGWTKKQDLAFLKALGVTHVHEECLGESGNTHFIPVERFVELCWR